ncbi:MAG TPA: hypothetical protein PKK48_04155 [Phycisphaerae bacterium]|nr:hypothetical protein [Phycisphaerae bacterium]
MKEQLLRGASGVESCTACFATLSLHRFSSCLIGKITQKSLKSVVRYAKLLFPKNYARQDSLRGASGVESCTACFATLSLHRFSSCLIGKITQKSLKSVVRYAKLLFPKNYARQDSNL